MRRTNHRNLVNVGILSGRIPLISLVQFIAVAEHLNFRHAAKALGISQVIVVRCALLIGVRRLAVAVAVLQR
ncbi:helix-turn-helix domain-containing protein, partial [Glaesserella parasuis]